MGASGHGLSVMEAARSAGFTIAGFVDPNSAADQIEGVRVAREIDGQLAKSHHFALGIGDNHLRERVFARTKSEFPYSSFPAIVHQSAEIAKSASIGEATVILAFGHVGARASIGAGVIVNSAASLDHESEMKDFSSLAPGAKTGGNVTIGIRTAVGINSTILPGRSVGNDVVIGAQSLVTNDIEQSTVAFGIPARATRQQSSV